MFLLAPVGWDRSQVGFSTNDNEAREPPQISHTMSSCYSIIKDYTHENETGENLCMEIY